MCEKILTAAVLTCNGLINHSDRILLTAKTKNKIKNNRWKIKCTYLQKINALISTTCNIEQQTLIHKDCYLQFTHTLPSRCQHKSISKIFTVAYMQPYISLFHIFNLTENYFSIYLTHYHDKWPLSVTWSKPEIRGVSLIQDPQFHRNIIRNQRWFRDWLM